MVESDKYGKNKIKNKIKTNKSKSFVNEEFAFNMEDEIIDPIIESQIHFLSNWDDMIQSITPFSTLSRKNTDSINEEKKGFTKNNSDPKKIKVKSKNSSDTSLKLKSKKKTKSVNLNNNDKKMDSEISEIENFVTQVDEKIDIQKYTSIEEIKDYYEYTENCLKIIKDLDPGTPEEINAIKVSLPESCLKKRLIVFDLDETLIHCDLKNPNQSEKQITITLPNNKKVRVSTILIRLD